MWYAEVSPKALQDLALQGKISNRIISWRLMLRVLQGTHEEIISQSWLQRENYYGLKEKLEPKASNELDANVFNPLSVSAQNPWFTHFKNQEVRKTIRLDVDRTFQKLDFFHNESIKITLENILFVWSMNHELGYRQGMNEIVAVIIYYGLTEEETIDSLSSKEHIEPDSYYIFDKIMDLGLDQLYTSNEYFRLKDDVFLEIPNLDRSGEEEISTSIRKCHYIFHKILASADFELYQHISRHKFEPQLFLLRWLRCMLSREFGIDEICYVWDVIFGFSGGNNLEILNYICTAMLVKSRETCKEYVVLKNFHSDLLQLLMKPMTISNIKELIEEAVKFQYNKIETKLYKVQAVKSQNNILNKIVNLFTENISSSHISMQVQNVITPLDEAFDYVIQAIQITEKAKNS